MSQQDLFDYVMNTPHNTNPAILKQKIKDISGASSWNDLKDKPFYTKTKIEPCVLLEMEATYDGESYYLSDYPIKHKFNPGDTVEVTLSGSDTHKDVVCIGVVEDQTWQPDVEINYVVAFSEEDREAFNLNVEILINVNTGKITFGYCSSIFPKFKVILPDVLVEEETVKKIEPKFVPNSAWLEEETFALVENVPMDTDGDDGYYASVDTDTALMVGDIVSVVLSNSDDGREGITVTGSVEEFRSVNATQYCLVHDGDFYCECRSTVWDYGEINLNVNVEHYQCATVIVNRQVIKTNCDLTVEIEEHEDASFSRIVRGTFDVAMAKIKKGLPVSAYVHGVYDWIADSYTHKDILAEVVSVHAIDRPNGEFLYFHTAGYCLIIRPDGSVYTD